MANSFLETTLARVRIMAQEPAINGILTDTELLEHFIEPAYAELIGELNNNSETAPVMQMTLSLANGTESYLLPPNIHRVRQLGRITTDKAVYADFVPLGFYNPWGGPGWSIQGNVINFRPTPVSAETWTLFYEVGGDVRLHYGNGTRHDSDATKFNLAASPTLGTVDLRPSAYVGCTLRIIQGGVNLIQERTITAYNPTGSGAEQVTVNLAFSPALGSGNIKYEIAPPMVVASPMQDAWALRAAIKLLTYKGISMSNYEKMVMEYRATLKALKDRFKNMNSRTGSTFQMDTNTNPDQLGNSTGWYFQGN